jgi:hypothetical protein
MSTMTPERRAQRIAELNAGAYRWEQEAIGSEAKAREYAPGPVRTSHEERAAECRFQAQRNRDEAARLQAWGY